MSNLNEMIARVCHEVNRIYCESMGDNSQPEWEEAPEWQVASAISGVQFHLDNPNSTPEMSHQNWCKDKVLAGWTWGPVKDPDKKQHPCLVPYEELPKEQQVKDAFFTVIVDSFREE